MENNKLTAKDSAFAFLFGFLLCQLSVVFVSCFTYIIFKVLNLNLESLSPFFNTAVGYMISSLVLYLVLLLVFFFFNHKKDNVISKPVKPLKILFYVCVALVSFLMLYPIIVCIDSLLVKCGFKLGTLSYSLSTKNYFISLISLVLAPAICEELLFRGIVFSGLKKHGKVFAILMSAFAFCLFHMSIGQTVYPILMGILLAVIMCYEQNIYYCMVVHFTNNFLSLTLSYFNINLIFNHWLYIVLAIILVVAFITVLLILTFKNHKNIEKEKLTKTDCKFLLISFGIMIILWIITNLA